MKPTVLSVQLRTPVMESEYDMDFLQGMVNRVAVSYHKYGAVADATTVNMLSSAQQRVETYMATGNTEYLIDAANFLMFEFMRHPEAFSPTDSDGSPGRMTVDGAVSYARNDA